MNSIKVIIQGYAQKLSDGRYKATSTTVLVHSAGKLILVDPGLIPAELKKALGNEHLQIDDIDFVVVTHTHQDHARNSRIFDKSKILDLLPAKRGQIPEFLWVPDTDIAVIYTPGHVEKHISLIVKTPAGKYAIAGDAFWWEDSQEQETDTLSLIQHTDPIAKDPFMLQNSRRELLGVADYIIPGHGKMFTTSR